MADLLERISELKSLPAEQHLFCPREGDDDGSVYYNEDIANTTLDDSPAAVKSRTEKINAAEERKWITLDSLQVLAFDGTEALAHQEWLCARLDALMTSCDVCVRVFHQSRAAWRSRLVEQFDEDMVHNFLKVVDNKCLERIQRGLDEANEVLQNADPKQRSVRILPNAATYAFFEALSCDALLRSEEMLQRHFDTPFQLVQTKKRLKLQTCLPAMTSFLFSKNEQRQNWAMASWSTLKRNVLDSEFDWAVRDHLVDAMMKVPMMNLELDFVPTYWGGVTLIVNRLDKELISNSIRGLEGDFYRLLLDHLSLDSNGFLDLVSTIKTILEKSPTDFWDAMDSLTAPPATVVEQVFNSPVLKHILSSATNEEEDIRNLDHAFSWVKPFMMSIKPTNLPPAVRAFANALFGRLQSDSYSRTSRSYCFKEGLRVLDHTFRKMCEGKHAANFVGQPTVNAMLDILALHIGSIVNSLKRLRTPGTQEDLRLALSTIQHAFTLEAHSTSHEKQLFQMNRPSPNEVTPSRPIWQTILKAIDPENIDLATQLLIAGREIIGLEPLTMKPGIEKIPPLVQRFNERFELLSRSITETVDRLAEFDPKLLATLFEQPPAASAIVSLLFSSTEDTRSSSIELLKVMSGKDERRDALQHLLRMHYRNSLTGMSDSCRRLSRKKTFAAAPSMIRTCADIIDVICNSQDGILRSRQLDSAEGGVTMNYWKNLWDALTVVFATTEFWSNNLGVDKHMMMDFCRDVMQFADQLFDQCSIFATALNNASKDEDGNSGYDDLLKELLQQPAQTMREMRKWLRLRDEFLNSKSVTLISKLLVRLHEVSIELDVETLQYMEDVLEGRIRAKISPQQGAELQRSLETHLGHQLIKEEEEPTKEQRQASLSRWMSTGSTPAGSKEKQDTRSKLMANVTPAANAFAEKRAAMKAKELQAKQARQDESKLQAQAEFKRKRQLEMERLKKEKEVAIAKARQARGLSSLTAEAGSGLEGLGILGRDSAAKGEGLMHSSDESDNEGDFDEELFGLKSSKSKTGPRTNIVNEVKVQMPVKKRRVQRSIKDMRARLAPDLSPLHKVILGWDYFHEGHFPPKSKDNYAAVLNTFRTPNEYQGTFQPLLTLEAWQGFVKAREESLGKPYEIRIVSKASVDAFQEVSSTMTHAENREIQVSEGDIILLSKSRTPSAQDPHCLARVIRIQRKKAHIEVSYRVVPTNTLGGGLAPNGTVFGTKIQSITPLEREYGALLGLQYYDLCDEICRAKPSPLLTYKDSQIEPLEGNYKLNRAQARAVKSAIDNDAFTLIQGPPGSGKTKTIVAIVGALLSDSFRHQGTSIQVPGQPKADSASKKLLVCAPSNAAVDELVMRFKDGIKSLSGNERKVNIVRLGRSDAINSNVQDVTLEQLVSKKLGMTTSEDKDTEGTRKLFQDHKEVSEKLREVIEKIKEGTEKGPEANKLQDDATALRRQKTTLGTKIDNAKDAERTASRNAELNRRRAQEQVLNEAHVICATLSGSGHEMFQNLSIEFETVIVDEAAQCVEMSALIPLKYGCAKCIILGDPKQLPTTVFSKEAARFQYEQSLFVRMQKNHPDDVHLLDTQYRMHPEISLFPSQTFYDGRLLDGGDMASLRQRPWHNSWLLGPYRFFDVQGQHQAAPKGHSLINVAEIKIALQLYQRLTTDHPNFDFHGKVGIITPYKSQLRELKTRFTTKYGPTITDIIDFNTTDAFQGRESEIIIFSCVRASPAGGIGFLQDIRRMNVGLTRAKSSLFVLGNSQSLVRGEFWRKLVEDAKSRDRYTEGDVAKMLNKPSTAYPARPGMFDHSERATPAPNIKKEIRADLRPAPMSRTHSAQSTNSSDTGSSMHIKREPSINSNGKRELSTLDSDGDTRMSDAQNASTPETTEETASDILPNGHNGASTPSLPPHLNSMQRSNGSKPTSASPTPPVAAGNPERPGDVVGGMMGKPKIRRRAKEKPSVLLSRPAKKPKMG